MHARTLGWVAVVLFLGGCDQFFEVCGQVTRCSDQTPLVGAKVTLELLSGFSSEESASSYTSPTGEFCATLNEPPDVSARLVIDKPGYRSISEDFAAAPDKPRDFCLELAAAP